MTRRSRSEDAPRGLLDRVRERLGIGAISRWTHEVNRQLEELSRDRDAARVRLAELESLERELEVWRFMAWLRREEPASDRLVSVVIATRNRARHLARCIESVFAQMHRNWQLVVVDDGSTDDTGAIIDKAASDPRVRSLRTEGLGVCAARNRALEHVEGSVVVYLDDDNRMDPLWTLAVAWAFDRWPDTRVLYGARLIDDEGTVHGRGPGGPPMLQFHHFDRAVLEQGNLVDTNVIAHRAGDPDARFDEQLSMYGDWDLMLRLSEQTAPRELPALACTYSTTAPGRLSDGSDVSHQRELDRIAAKLERRG